MISFISVVYVTNVLPWFLLFYIVNMHPESDCGSMKLLLKQVYGVHTAKVKSLEEEIDDLKRNLFAAESKLKTECKRCTELEEAFNSCKAALHEQSKWFENLGQRFSTTENKSIGEKVDKTLCGFADSHDEQSGTQVAVNKTSALSSAKKHFLQNVMSLNSDECLDSLDLSCAPFPKNKDYSTLNPDSFVLVPNTLDFMTEVQFKHEKDGTNDDVTVLKNDGDYKCSDVPKQLASSSTKVVTQSDDNKETKKMSKKRHSEDSTPLSTNAFDKENNGGICFKNKKLKSVVKKSNTENLNKQNDNVSPVNEKSTDSGSILSTTANKNYSALNVKTHRKILNVSPTNSCKNADNDASKEEECQILVSPSLLPLNEKTNTKALMNPPVILEDISDFQVPSVSKKTSNDSGSWTSCDKKKIAKKVANVKPIKSTSKFRMQLDSLPPNYKKPTYRQTKLSKSIFQPKPSCKLEEADLENVDYDEMSSDFESSLPTAVSNLQVSTGTSKTVDFDATCIPDNYEYKTASTCDSVSGKAPNRDFPNSIMIVKDSTDESEEDSPEMIVKPAASSRKERIKNQDKGINKKQTDSVQLGNSFDRLPKKAEPDYKYKEETVRNKSERKQLTAFDCKECEKYYSDLGLSDEEKQKRMHKCSRHRGKFAPPPTPEHFWELEFPDTQECKARGYLNETQKGKLKSHRKRPL